MNVLITSQHFPSKLGKSLSGSLLCEIREISKRKKITIFLSVIDDIDQEMDNCIIIQRSKCYKISSIGILKFISCFFDVTFKIGLKLVYLNRSNFAYLIKTVKYNIAFQNIIKKNDIHLIHSHWFGPNCTAGIFAAERTKVPVIVSARGNDIYMDREREYGMRLNPLKDCLIKYAAKNVDAIIVASKKMQKIAEELSGDIKKIYNLPNGIDTNLFHPNIEMNKLRENLIDPHDYLLLSVGGLTPIKNQKVILEAVRKLQNNNYKVKSVIIGKGRLKEDLLKLADSLNISKSVQIIDFVENDDMPDFYRASDCLVHPSNHEGFGNVIVESLACGNPVICSNEGVARDHFGQCSDVKVIKNISSDEIVEGFIELVIKKEEIDSYPKGRDVVLEKFTISSRIDKLVNIYGTFRNET